MEWPEDEELPFLGYNWGLSESKGKVHALSQKNMTEFWESSFRVKQLMWGLEPADSAVATADLFQKNGLNEVLIPGFGYGRNVKPFIDQGCNVTGIEISETAIEIAKRDFGENLSIYHGSVIEMPFDRKMYDGIFCYALIHLLNKKGRQKLVRDCYFQLRPGGYMVFVAISRKVASYGEGVKLSKDRFKTKHGVKLFYYSSESVDREFGNYGLIEATEIKEPTKNMENMPSQRFWRIICRKEQLRDQ